MMAVDLPSLDLLPDQDVNFELLYMHMARHIAQLTEEKDTAGERLYTDACQWMGSCFATQTLKDKLACPSDIAACFDGGLLAGINQARELVYAA